MYNIAASMKENDLRSRRFELDRIEARELLPVKGHFLPIKLMTTPYSLPLITRNGCT